MNTIATKYLYFVSNKFDKLEKIYYFEEPPQLFIFNRLVKTVGSRTNREVAVGGAVGNLARCSTGRESLFNW